MAGCPVIAIFNDATSDLSLKSTLRYFQRICDHGSVKKSDAPDTSERRRRALQAYINAHHLVRSTWAREAGVSETSLRWFLSGKTRSLNEETYRKLAANRKVPIGVLRGEESGIPEVPVRSYVGAGAEVVPFDEDDPIDIVEAPPGMEESEAMVVRGDSGRPMFADGDVLFPAPPSTEIARHIGSVVVLQLRDGRRTLKRLLRGSKKDRWRLISVNPDVPPLEDQIVSWVAPIPWVKRKL